MSVNVGRGRQIAISRRGRPVITAIGKSAVSGAGSRCEGSTSPAMSKPIGVFMAARAAIYAYASEDTTWWATMLGSERRPGAFGENLTTIGGDVSGAVIGERSQIGSSQGSSAATGRPSWRPRSSAPDWSRRYASAPLDAGGSLSAQSPTIH